MSPINFLVSRFTKKRKVTDTQLNEIFNSISDVLSELIKTVKGSKEQIQLLSDRLTIIELNNKKP